MSKRLQVLLEEKEWADIQRAARLKRVTIAEWVRQALRAARRREPLRDSEKKLKAIRAAALHSFPTGDMNQILSEIEQGYLGGHPQ